MLSLSLAPSQSLPGTGNRASHRQYFYKTDLCKVWAVLVEDGAVSHAAATAHQVPSGQLDRPVQATGLYF